MALCLGLGAGSAGAETIQLRGLGARNSYTFTDVITFKPTFTDTAGWSFGSSAGAEFTFDGSTLPPGGYGVAGFAPARERLEASSFAAVVPSNAPSAFDDLRGPRLESAAGGTPHAALAERRPATEEVRQGNVWVMVLVALGTVLYQLRRKQRTLEQDPLAA
jgi:hypothetical protein